MPQIIFSVTNDLNYDQRMIRICTSLSDAGYKVKIIGVKKKNSSPLQKRPYHQKRIYTFIENGFLFYAIYNIQLFFYLLFSNTKIYGCIDLDTMLPNFFASILRNKKRVYDAHEYFSQQKEIIERPRVYKIWHWIEKIFVPKFKSGYTVSHSIAAEFKKLYGVNYQVIRNISVLKDDDTFIDENLETQKIILYQGAVNHARGLETLIPAMQNINAVLHIYGDGNFMEQTKSIIAKYNLAEKVMLKGKFLPHELKKITSKAFMGINLVEPIGLNQQYSLANKFFDYIHVCVPQITMNFTEYAFINNLYQVAILINDVEIKTIENAINQLLNNSNLYHQLKANCLMARQSLNWQKEEQILINFYAPLLNKHDKLI